MRRRNKNVSVRMTEDEYAAFMIRVAESGQTQQSFIINSVLGAKVSGREEVKELQKLNGQLASTNRQLRGYGNQHQSDGTCGKRLRTDTTAITTKAAAPRAAGVPKGV